MRPSCPLIFLSIERCLLILGCQHKINTPLIYQVQDKTTRWFINSRRTITHESPTTTEYTTTSTYKLKKTSTHKHTTQTTPDTSTHQLTTPSTHRLKKTPTHQRVSSQTHKFQTHQLTNSSIQKVKIIIFILQYHSNFHSVLAKI